MEDAKAVRSGGSLKLQLLAWASTGNREKNQPVTAPLLGGSHHTDDTKGQSYNHELYCALSPVGPSPHSVGCAYVSFTGKQGLAGVVKFGRASSEWVRVSLPSTHGYPFKEKRITCRERRGWSREEGDGNQRHVATSPGALGPSPAITRSQEEAKVQRLPNTPEREGPCQISSVNFWPPGCERMHFCLVYSSLGI